MGLRFISVINRFAFYISFFKVPKDVTRGRVGYIAATGKRNRFAADIKK